MIIEIVLILLTSALLYNYFKRPKGIPPGIWGYPLIGHVPPKSIPFRKYLEKLKNQYGDMYSVKLGGRLYIMLSDYAKIKAAFAKPEFTGRPDFFSFRIFMYFKNLGIGGSENKVWHDNRRFALNQLRDLGMGRSIMEDTIDREVTALIQELDKGLGKPCRLEWNVNVAVLNVIWGLIASKRFDINDPKIMQFSELLSKTIDIIQGPMQVLDAYPQIIPFVPSFIKNKYMQVDTVINTLNSLFDHFQEEINEHEKHLDVNDPKDYIDGYLIEIKNQLHDKDSTFRPDHMDMKVSIGDLFFAGSETTATSIRFTCLYLILHPEIQEKIQKQIDDVLPRHTRPSLEHRDKLAYLDATLLEVQRRATLVPLGIAHSAMKDTVFEGYNIPKGTVMMPLQEDCHNNPKYWEKPDEFYPEHFIDEDGKLITKKDGFLPFSVGRRVCPGESLAKIELFLFMAAILQRYKLSELPGEKLEIKVNWDFVLINGMKPFNLKLTLRE